jgi:dinuclear metal center YbgI/SA1388 family protein
MILLDELKAYLADLLGEPPEGVDANANGLQVPGRREIRRIGFGVSASQDLFKIGHAAGCDSIIVHHGIGVPSGPHFDDVFLGRIKFLLEREISLFGYHYTLDSHPEIGHAARIINALGGKITKRAYDGWGWYGELAEPMRMDDASKMLKGLFGCEGVVYPVGPSPFTKVVAISGGGSPAYKHMRELMDEGVGLYITGEPKEHVREMMREARINFFAGGHYCTERVGVKALQEKVQEKFDVPCEWLELFNEI